MKTLKKRLIKRPLICGVAIAAVAILGLSALAAPPDLPEIVPSDATAHKYTVTVDASDGIASAGEVIMIAIKGKGEYIPTALSADDIAYIDQTTVIDGSARFKDFTPAASDSVVFIAGAGLTEPKPIGYITGWGVKGTIRVSSYDPKKGIVATLYKTGTEDVEATQTIAGAAVGAGSSTVSFDFEGIPDGTYDLLIRKDGHLGYAITNIVVSGLDVDLTANLNPLISIITLPAGDLNGDGYINSTDVSVLVALANYGSETQNADNALADINGDGFVNSTDVSLLVALANYGQSTINVNYSE
jgi:hypothetical protein